MNSPPWLMDVLVVVGNAGVKAIRQGMREGAANAVDSVLEDVQELTDEIGRRVRKGRSTLRKKKPPVRKAEPEVIDVTEEE